MLKDTIRKGYITKGARFATLIIAHGVPAIVPQVQTSPREMLGNAEVRECVASETDSLRTFNNRTCIMTPRAAGLINV
jgi:hypothetical protein